MERRINSRMILVGILSLLLTASMGCLVFHRAMDTQIRDDVRQTGKVIARGYERSGDVEFLKDAVQEENNLRLTLISPEGRVLFESLKEGD